MNHPYDPEGESQFRQSTPIDVTPQKPKPTTYVKVRPERSTRRPGGCLRFWATVLIAAIIGGAVGAGGANYFNKEAPPQESTRGIAKSLTPQERTGADQPITEIAERVVPTVVGITNYGRISDIFGRTREGKQATGSGVIIRSDGTIVTNFHVISGASKITVTLADGKTHDAKVVGYDQSSDLAVLKIEGKDFPAIAIGDSSALRVGELAVAVGNPLGENFSQTVTDGIISGINRKIEAGNRRFTLIQTNCAINTGNSGGALVNGEGQLVGINSVKIQAEGVEGLGFAIPVNNVMKIVTQIEKEGIGDKDRPFIGVSGYSLTPEMAQQLQIEETQGLLVMQIVKDSPADQAGIKPGDVITHLNGSEIKSYDDLAAQLQKLKVGDKIQLTLSRNTEIIDVQVVLAANTDQTIPKN